MPILRRQVSPASAEPAQAHPHASPEIEMNPVAPGNDPGTGKPPGLRQAAAKASSPLLRSLDDVVDIQIREDLYEVQGLDSMATGTRFHVVAATPHGFQFEHTKVFNDNTRWEADEDDVLVLVRDWEARDRAAKFAEAVRAHLQAGGKLDPGHWNEAQGVYGSPGWDEARELSLEAAEEGF